MDSLVAQANYRAIFTEMLLAHSAAMGAFTDVAARCAVLAGQQYPQGLATLAGKIPARDGAAGPAHPGGGSGNPEVSSPRPVDVARAIAGMPRLSMMVFLSHYDKLRGRRDVVRD
jgi:hypothetical protein